jgi:hypothetical protein
MNMVLAVNVINIISSSNAFNHSVLSLLSFSLLSKDVRVNHKKKTIQSFVRCADFVSCINGRTRQEISSNLRGSSWRQRPSFSRWYLSMWWEFSFGLKNNYCNNLFVSVPYCTIATCHERSPPPKKKFCSAHFNWQQDVHPNEMSYQIA